MIDSWLDPFAGRLSAKQARDFNQRCRGGTVGLFVI
jgi:hypothetical protein